MQANGAVVGIFGNDGRHPDRIGIPPLFEQGIEVGVVDRPQRPQPQVPRNLVTTDQRG